MGAQTTFSNFGTALRDHIRLDISCELLADDSHEFSSLIFPQLKREI